MHTSHARSGVASGGAFEYVRSSNSSSETLRSRRIRAVYDVPMASLDTIPRFLTRHLSLLSQTASLRADDHATIGALLFAVLTPSIFWKRAATIHRRSIPSNRLSRITTSSSVIFGGAGLGTAAGYFAHVARSASGDVPPKVVPQIASDS